MAITFHSPCVFVADMARARAFYETTLGQTPTLVLDGYVAYAGFSLWRTDTATRHIFDEPTAVPAGPMGRDNFELYFETDAIEEAWDRVLSGAEMIHAMKIQPWGQRCFRVRDPDGHIVELAEPMETVIRRMRASGRTEQEIVAATMMPPQFVKNVLAS
uniref:VOC domain-containing protein n=1 Tax=Desulfovibrio sp. U5L TaxID=596152 RepID=I2PXZ4_9BACT